MSRDVVVYDGDCGICEWSARWVKTHVPSVDVISHREYGVSHLASVWLITWSGRHEGAAAVAAVLKRADNKNAQRIGTLISLPIVRIVAKAVYWLVAKNRRTISRLCGLKACGISPR